jgi:hypothetical protein
VDLEIGLSLGFVHHDHILELGWISITEIDFSRDSKGRVN